MTITFGFYGRSGQGVEKAVQLFARACFMSGLYVQSFTFIGSDRRASPVTGYVKTDRVPLMSKQVEEPDFYVIFDASVMHANYKENSLVILNAPQKPISEALKRKKVKVYSVDATEIALNTLKANVPNTVMIGALSKLFNKISMKSIRTAMENDGLPRENVNALEEGYRNVR